MTLVPARKRTPPRIGLDWVGLDYHKRDRQTHTERERKLDDARFSSAYTKPQIVQSIQSNQPADRKRWTNTQFYLVPFFLNCLHPRQKHRHVPRVASRHQGKREIGHRDRLVLVPAPPSRVGTALAAALNAVSAVSAASDVRPRRR